MANVNVPTNFAQKEKDINTKLQLYGKRLVAQTQLKIVLM